MFWPINAFQHRAGSGGRAGPPQGAPPGNITFQAVNQRKARFADAYHWMLNCSWAKFVGIIVGGYITANLGFALMYTLVPGAVIGSSGFIDNFFFSVQTWATIGYGGMTPRGLLPNILVVFESMSGIFGVALLTGLLFAKFSRPESRVLFANKAVVQTYNGKRTLMIRLANERGSNIVEATAHVTVIRAETTPEGMTMRRIHDLKLVRSTQPAFRLSWTVMHVIDEHSALHGVDAENIEASGLRLFINMMGYDASVGQTSHASALYNPDQVRFGFKYRDATRDVEGIGMAMDYLLFHDIEPALLLA